MFGLLKSSKSAAVPTTEEERGRIAIKKIYDSLSYRLFEKRDELLEFLATATRAELKGAIAEKDRGGNNFLHIAAGCLPDENFSKLIDKIDSDDLTNAILVQNNCGANPLHFAAALGYDNLTILLDRVTDATAKTALCAQLTSTVSLVFPHRREGFHCPKGTAPLDVLTSYGSKKLISIVKRIPEIIELAAQMPGRERSSYLTYFTSRGGYRYSKEEKDFIFENISVGALDNCMSECGWLHVANSNSMVSRLLSKGVTKGLNSRFFQAVADGVVIASNEVLAKLRFVMAFASSSEENKKAGQALLDVIYKNANIATLSDHMGFLLGDALNEHYHTLKPYFKGGSELSILELRSHISTILTKIDNATDDTVKQNLARHSAAAHAILAVITNDDFRSSGHQAALKEDAILNQIYQDLLSSSYSDELVRLREIAALGEHDLDDSKKTALHRAVQANDKDLVLKLLEKKVDVTAPDVWGWTPLHYAANLGRAVLVDLLIINGATTKATSLLKKSVLTVADRSHPEMMAKLKLVALIDELTDELLDLHKSLGDKPGKVTALFKQSKEKVTAKVAEVTVNRDAAKEILGAVLRDEILDSEINFNNATSKELFAICRDLAEFPCGARIDLDAFLKILDKDEEQSIALSTLGSVNGGGK